MKAGNLNLQALFNNPEVRKGFEKGSGINAQDNALFKEDEPIMKQCAYCKRLMRWKVGKYGTKKCKICTAVYDDEAQIDNRAEAIDPNAGTKEATGHGGIAVSTANTNAELSRTTIGYGKHSLRLKQTQQYTQSYSYSVLKMLKFKHLLSSTLNLLRAKHGLQVGDSHVNAAIAKWEQFDKLKNRKIMRGTDIAVLSQFLYESLGGKIAVETIEGIMHEIEKGKQSKLTTTNESETSNPEKKKRKVSQTTATKLVKITEASNREKKEQANAMIPDAIRLEKRGKIEQETKLRGIRVDHMLDAFMNMRSMGLKALSGIQAFSQDKMILPLVTRRFGASASRSDIFEGISNAHKPRMIALMTSTMTIPSQINNRCTAVSVAQIATNVLDSDATTSALINFESFSAKMHRTMQEHTFYNYIRKNRMNRDANGFFDESTSIDHSIVEPIESVAEVFTSDAKLSECSALTWAQLFRSADIRKVLDYARAGNEHVLNGPLARMLQSVSIALDYMALIYALRKLKVKSKKIKSMMQTEMGLSEAQWHAIYAAYTAVKSR